MQEIAAAVRKGRRLSEPAIPTIGIVGIVIFLIPAFLSADRGGSLSIGAVLAGRPAYRHAVSVRANVRTDEGRPPGLGERPLDRLPAGAVNSACWAPAWRCWVGRTLSC